MKAYPVFLFSVIIILSISVNSEDRFIDSDSRIVNLVKHELLTKTDDASSFRENIQLLRNQNYTYEEALYILHNETVNVVKYLIFLKNMSKQDVEEHLLKRGYSISEVDTVIETACSEVTYAALNRGMKKKTIISRLTEKGFTREEINLVLMEVSVEQAKSAYSSGISSTVIVSNLDEMGFTKQEIEEILIKAGLSAPPKNKICLMP